MNEPSEARPVLAPQPSSRWMWLLGLSILILGAPFYVEHVQYALVRGRERAQVDAARTQLTHLNDTAAAFRLVAQSVGPSVVHIDAMRTIDLSEFLPDKIPGEKRADRPHKTPRRPEQQGKPEPPGKDEHSGKDERLDYLHPSGQGSGVIVDPAGYILTNYHVVRGTRDLRVRLSDGRVFRTVKVAGIDALTDLAVLKIDAHDLTAAPWGDSQSLQAGDWVLAVGNPYGLDRSVTAGIVSATRRRQIVHDVSYQDFVQTDAVVNPGSSGGPLVNLRGEVVGINTAIVGPGYQGISFAIPSDIARNVYQRLKETGKFTPGWLGVALRSPSDDEADAKTGKQVKGATVASVFPQSPAEKAGVQVGDVVVEWNASAVDDFTDLGLLVAKTEVDTRAKIVVLRGGKRMTLEVPVGGRPPELSP